MSHGFDIISRRAWNARPPRSRTPRSPRGVNTVYIHWPGGPAHIASRDDREALRVPEAEAADCYLPEDLISRAAYARTRDDLLRLVRDIQDFHMDGRGWSDIAYNYLIGRSGLIVAGRTFKYVPASQAPFNTNGVSICCLMGTEDRVSSTMRENLFDFVRWCEQYARHDLATKGHRQVNQTTCPGDRLMKLVPQLNAL